MVLLWLKFLQQEEGRCSSLSEPKQTGLYVTSVVSSWTLQGVISVSRDGVRVNQGGTGWKISHGDLTCDMYRGC